MASSQTSRNQTLVSVQEPEEGLARYVVDVGMVRLTKAVNTLKGIGTDDDVGETGTILKHEDGVVTAGVFVRVASVTTVELLVAVVLTTSDDTGLRERGDLANTSRYVEGLSRRDAGKKCRELNLRELHNFGFYNKNL